jgi:hypothetical protein
MLLLKSLAFTTAFFFGLTLRRIYNSAMEDIPKTNSRKRPTPPPAVPGSSNTSNKTSSNRHGAKRKDDKENAELAMKEYWSDKKASLDKPFEIPGEEALLVDAIKANASAVRT